MFHRVLVGKSYWLNIGTGQAFAENFKVTWNLKICPGSGDFMGLSILSAVVLPLVDIPVGLYAKLPGL